MVAQSIHPATLIGPVRIRVADGLNSWSSPGASPAPPGAAGLQSFVIKVPAREEQARLAERLREAGGALRARDLWNVGLEVTA